jgi:hypothetical protein
MVEVAEANRTDWRPSVVLSIPVGSILKLKGISNNIKYQQDLLG